MLSASTSASAAAWGRKQAAMGVLSATLVGLENRTTNLSAPVRLAFADDDANASLVPSRCVYWDWNAGAWAGTGCALAADDDTCVCSHLTYFALLFVCRCFFRALSLDVLHCRCRGATDVIFVSIKSGRDTERGGRRRRDRDRCSSASESNRQARAQLDLADRLLRVDRRSAHHNPRVFGAQVRCSTSADLISSCTQLPSNLKYSSRVTV